MIDYIEIKNLTMVGVGNAGILRIYSTQHYMGNAYII